MRLISQILVLLSLLWSCSASSSKESLNKKSTAKTTHQEQKSATSKKTKEANRFEIHTLQSANGWAYQIFENGKLMIDQPCIPGKAGVAGFSTEQDARNVANLVTNKLKAKIFPPTVSEDDLKNLNIH
ncbi:MAG: hypothetical protein RLZZ65_1283 [Bacteroidota bacterium]|jgi:uncharacterized protein GlcG (DUF336 family)